MVDDHLLCQQEFYLAYLYLLFHRWAHTPDVCCSPRVGVVGLGVGVGGARPSHSKSNRRTATSCVPALWAPGLPANSSRAT